MKVKMKYVYKLQLVSLLVVSLMTMTGCELETSDNGKLDGYWHLVAVDCKMQIILPIAFICGFLKRAIVLKCSVLMLIMDTRIWKMVETSR